jgi:putative oxygen-independent coproporphyrinogen III oxidase
MAGIYLHIPFCESRCIYCSFYSTVRQEKLKDRYVAALCRELSERKDYIRKEQARTLYIGGGTPSQLSISQLSTIFECIAQHFSLSLLEEVTIEANPDDLTESYLSELKQLPVNRISMGIQTFDNSALKFLNRRHDAEEAIHAVELCRKVGFNNFSIDLIYGLPGETLEQWKNDIRQTLALRPPHISAYSLSYDQGTPLCKMLQEGKVNEVNEQQSLAYYTLLMKELKQAGYEHYEISNFCLPGCHSRHNSSYWQGIPYLGCGAAAHSYNGNEREWNIADLKQYTIGIEQGERNFETEELDEDTRYNELVMTSLRTANGVDLELLNQKFGKKYYDYCMKMSEPHILRKKMECKDGRLRLTESGIFVSNDIISDLFVVSL